MLYVNTHHLLIHHFDLSKTVAQFLRNIPGPLSMKRLLWISDKQSSTVKLNFFFFLTKVVKKKLSELASETSLF